MVLVLWRRFHQTWLLPLLFLGEKKIGSTAGIAGTVYRHYRPVKKRGDGGGRGVVGSGQLTAENNSLVSFLFRPKGAAWIGRWTVDWWC